MSVEVIFEKIIDGEKVSFVWIQPECLKTKAELEGKSRRQKIILMRGFVPLESDKTDVPIEYRHVK